MISCRPLYGCLRGFLNVPFPPAFLLRPEQFLRLFLFGFVMQVVLEEALKEERQKGKEFAEEIKEETKKEMLEYSRVKQEVKYLLLMEIIE